MAWLAQSLEDNAPTARAAFATISHANGAAFTHVLAMRRFVVVVKVGWLDRHVDHISRFEGEVVFCGKVSARTPSKSTTFF